MRLIIISLFAAAFTFSCRTSKTQTETYEAADPTVETRRTVERGSSSNGRAAPSDRKGRPSVDEVFKMDTDNDGKLSKSEVDGPLAREFKNIDINNDGYITREEFENAPKPQRAQRPRKKQ